LPSTYPSTSQNSNKRAEQVLSVLESIIESNFNESIKEAACKKYKLTPKLSSSEKQKEKIKVLRENNSSMTKILGNKENDVTNFLSSSKSFSQYNKERMDTFFVPKSIAETIVQKRFGDEKAQRRKPKVSIGKFSNYQFDKTKFLQDMKSIPSGTALSWTELPRK
jgi:hypothetical protein